MQVRIKIWKFMNKTTPVDEAAGHVSRMCYEMMTKPNYVGVASNHQWSLLINEVSLAGTRPSLAFCSRNGLTVLLLKDFISLLLCEQ